LPGKTPREAVEAFSAPLRESLACILPPTVFLRAQGEQADGGPYLLTLLGHRGPTVPLGGPHGIGLFIALYYSIMATADPQAPWRVQTRGYRYQLTVRDGRELVGYHWHPGSLDEGAVEFPHAHFHTLTDPPGLSKPHWPTGRVPLESVIRLALRDLGVPAQRPDWAAVLERNEAIIRRWSSWGSGDPSTP
jgi:hypothetical protein